MELSLAENIRVYRKKRKLTQEQLAEAMGVTVGAVSKWESASTIPDLILIAELAAFFEISVDALLGYELSDSGRTKTVENIRALTHRKLFEDACKEAQKALIKFPNCIEIVCCAAELYHAVGMERKDKEMVKQAQKLYRHSLHLLWQNEDRKVEEAEIQNQLAQTWVLLGEPELAVAQYKKYNYAGSNHARIGYLLAQSGKYQEASEWLADAALHHTTELIRAAMGMAECAVSTGNVEEAVQLLEWMRQMISGLKVPGKISYMDRAEVVLLSEQMRYYDADGKTDAAVNCLKQAAQIAAKFDAAPVYTTDNLRFYHSGQQLISDDFGNSAMQGLENCIFHARKPVSQRLQKAWEELRCCE